MIFNNIKTLRKKHGLTQEELCQTIGISRQHLSQIERNLAIPSIIIALKIAVLFDKRVEEIFYL